MTDNKLNQMPQIPMGVLNNVNEMLLLGEEDLSDDNGRLNPEELASLREEMKSKVETVCKGFIDSLHSVCDSKMKDEELSSSVYNVFNNFGSKLTLKVSTRYQNAHERITYNTIVGYVFEEISEDEKTQIINDVVNLINDNKASYTENVKNVVENKIKSLEEEFKSIEVQSEKQKELENKSIGEIELNPKDDNFVENVVKKVEYLLDNEGKKSMLKYVESLAQELAEAKK